MPLDTKYLSEENYYKLLGAFDNLDEILHGELIKSDNFQALNSLMPKYQDKIDLIYIDPPYYSGVYTEVFKLLKKHAKPTTIFIAEHSEPLNIEGFSLIKEKNYGGKLVSFFALQP